MNILIIDIYNNGLFAADKLAKQYSEVSKVILVSEYVRTSMWQSEKLTIIQERYSIDQIVELAKSESIDLAVNFNSMYGKAGLLETLESAGIPCIGSDAPFSKTETNKREFRHWLLKKGFNTPQILFEGYYDTLLKNYKDFSYPLVIKPDSQIGPRVMPCHSAEELEAYLEDTVTRVPYAVNAIIFVIEEYVPVLDELYVTYFMCDGKPYIWETNRLPNSWKATRDAGECAYALVPNPNFEPYKEEIDSYLSQVSEFSENFVGIVQCAISEDRELYFIESNARPPTAAFGMIENPLEVLLAMKDKSYSALSERLDSMNSNGAVIALMHAKDKIPIDVDALNGMEGFTYWPNSVEKEEGEYISYRKGAPSFLQVRGDTLDEVVSRLKDNLSAIENTGEYLRIEPESIKALYHSQGGASE